MSKAYSSAEIAEALGLTVRAVNYWAAREAWPRYRLTGVRGYQYPIAGLPSEVQAALEPSASVEPTRPVRVVESAGPGAPVFFCPLSLFTLGRFPGSGVALALFYTAWPGALNRVRGPPYIVNL